MLCKEGSERLFAGWRREGSSKRPESVVLCKESGLKDVDRLAPEGSVLVAYLMSLLFCVCCFASKCWLKSET